TKKGYVETTKGVGGWTAGKARPARQKISGVQEEAKGDSMAKRHFEFKEGSSNKFWEVELNGESLTTWWGRIGTAGQSKTKDFGDVGEAKKAYDKLVGEKLKEGYAEGGGAAPAKPAA